VIPESKTIIEVDGPWHFLADDKKTRSGNDNLSTQLKQLLGY
jgi:hypothetical protein